MTAPEIRASRPPRSLDESFPVFDENGPRSSSIFRFNNHMRCNLKTVGLREPSPTIRGLISRDSPAHTSLHKRSAGRSHSFTSDDLGRHLIWHDISVALLECQECILVAPERAIDAPTRVDFEKAQLPRRPSAPLSGPGEMSYP